jgi:hypothetical protein
MPAGLLLSSRIQRAVLHRQWLQQPTHCAPAGLRMQQQLGAGRRQQLLQHPWHGRVFEEEPLWGASHLLQLQHPWHGRVFEEEPLWGASHLLPPRVLPRPPVLKGLSVLPARSRLRRASPVGRLPNWRVPQRHVGIVLGMLS